MNRPKIKQRRKTPVMLYAWLCINCRETGQGRAPHLCTKCKSPMVKEIKTEINEGVDL